MSFSDAAVGLKMAIMDVRYPDKFITQEQATILKEWLLERIQESGTEGVSPRFLEDRLRGSVFFVCFDHATKNWLEKKLERGTSLA